MKKKDTVKLKDVKEAPEYIALLKTIEKAKTKTKGQKILDNAAFPYCIDQSLQDAVDNLK